MTYNDEVFTPARIMAQRAVYRLANWYAEKGDPDQVVIPGLNSGAETSLRYKGNRIEVDHRGVDFKYGRDWPWTTVIVDLCARVDEDGPADLYVVMARNLRTGMFLLDAPATMPLWTIRHRKDNRSGETLAYYECPKEHWLCDGVSCRALTFIPKWEVQPSDDGTTSNGALNVLLSIQRYRAFNGDQIAPIAATAQEQGYKVAMTPVRIR